MQNTFWRSISGRVFSRTGSDDGREDPFAYMLSRLHREAANVGIGGAPTNPGGPTLFDADLLGYASYAAEIYRHQCPPGLWDMDAFIDDLNEVIDENGEMSVEELRQRFAGALLFCVDRSLAYYQRGRYRGKFNLTEHWADCAQSLRFSLLNLDSPGTENGNDSREKMKQLNLARHRANHAARERVGREWEKDPAKWPSAERAGLFFVDLLASEGVNYEPRTVTGWIRAHAKKVGVRFR